MSSKSISTYFASSKQSSATVETSERSIEANSTHSDQIDEGSVQSEEERKEIEEEDDIEENNDLESGRAKRKVAPAFPGEAILKRKKTRWGNYLLTSVEETKLPEMSMRSRPREENLLVGNIRSVKSVGESKTEIHLRISDKINMGHFITKSVDGLNKLWCKVCLKVVNSNKSNTAAHMNSAMHKNNVEGVVGKLSRTTACRNFEELEKRQP